MGKATVSGIPFCLKYCVIFGVCTEFINLAAGCCGLDTSVLFIPFKQMMV